MKKPELEELKVSIYDKLRKSIEKEDKEGSLSLLDELIRNKEKLLGVYLTWVDLLLTYIADNLGEEAVHETMRTFDRRAVRESLKGAFGPIPIEERLKKRTYIMTSAYGINYDSIEEDEEKFTLKWKCPSGGRVRTFEQHGKTKEAHPWSWGEKGMAYYCTHCATSFEIMTIEQLGYPGWVTTHEPGGICVQRLYKDVESVPEKYYKRVGKTKKGTRKPGRHDENPVD